MKIDRNPHRWSVARLLRALVAGRAGARLLPALLLAALLLPAVAKAASPAPVDWGLHELELENSTVVVRSRWHMHRDHDPSTPIELAAPLPADAELSGARAVTDETGAVVALRVDDPSALTVRMPWSQVKSSGTLPVAIPEGDSVHRIVLGPAIGFSPDPQLGLVAQVGHYAPADIDVVARHRFDERTDQSHRNVGAYYVRGRDLATTRALQGEVEHRRARMGRALLVALGVFVLVVLAMVVMHRRLDRSVRHERAEAYLAQEFESLEP